MKDFKDLLKVQLCICTQLALGMASVQLLFTDDEYEDDSMKGCAKSLVCSKCFKRESVLQLKT